jgi:hypothetical protein
MKTTGRKHAGREEHLAWPVRGRSLPLPSAQRSAFINSPENMCILTISGKLQSQISNSRGLLHFTLGNT